MVPLERFSGFERDFLDTERNGCRAAKLVDLIWLDRQFDRQSEGDLFATPLNEWAG